MPGISTPSSDTVYVYVSMCVPFHGGETEPFPRSMKIQICTLEIQLFAF